MRASCRVRNLPQRVSYLGDKWLDPPVRLWYHVLTWFRRARRQPVPICVCQPPADRGVEEIVPKLQDAGQLYGVPLGTNPGAGLCRAPSKLLGGGTRMGA